MNKINPFSCPGCGHVHDLRDTPEGALSYEFTVTAPGRASVGAPEPISQSRCIFTLTEREDSRIVLTYDPKCTHTAAGMDLVLDAAQVIKSAKRSGKTEHYRERLIVELQSHLADALEKIHKLTSKVDEFRSIMASIRDERDQAVAQVAIQDQAYREASSVRAIISNSQSKAMLRMAAALADLLPQRAGGTSVPHQSRAEAITMHAIVLTDAEWAAWLTRSSH
jgi:hypothetical protein